MTQPVASSAPDPADIRRLFARIVESPRDQWAALVQRIEDASVRRDVQALLDAHAKALDKGFMSNPTGPSPTASTYITPITEQPGTRIGPFKLLEEIGEGGFGVVFMAEQTAPIRRRVALKVIKLGMDTRQIVARFEQERQALALMDHPHIARVLDGGTTDSGRPYFVMEYVKGDPITAFAAAHQLNVRQRLDLFTQVCQAVQHAHHKGIIHRDLKPGNVLVSMTDGKPFAKVIDFGIAKATGAALTDKTLFTEHRQLIGTPEYMSPEQAEGSPDIDTRADVYALGVLLYELLTGLTPFDGRRLRSAAYAEMQRIIREEEPPAPSMRLERSLKVLAAVHAGRASEPPAAADGPPTPQPTAPAELSDTRLTPRDLAGELDWIVMKALDKDRTRRYDTPNQLAADVQRHLTGEAVQAAPPSMGYRLRKFVRRYKGPVVAGAAVMLALAAGGSVAAWQWRVATTARQQAEATNKSLTNKRDEVRSGLEDLSTILLQSDASDGEFPVQFPEDGSAPRGSMGTVWFTISTSPDGARHVSVREVGPDGTPADNGLLEASLVERATDAARGIHEANISLLQQRDEAEWSAYTANLALAQAAIANHDWLDARRRLENIPKSKLGWEGLFLKAQAAETLYASASVTGYQSPDGEWLAQNRRDNALVMLRTGTGEELRLDTDSPYSYWSPDGRTLVTWSSDYSRAGVWEHKDGSVVRTGSLIADTSVWRGGFVDNAQCFITASTDGTLLAWDLKHLNAGHPQWSARVSENNATIVLTTCMGSVFTVTSLYGGKSSVQAWTFDAARGLEQVQVLYPNGGPRVSVRALSADGTFILVQEDGVTLIWRRQTDGQYEKAATLLRASSTNDIQIDPHAQFVIGGCDLHGGRLARWRIGESGLVQPELVGPNLDVRGLSPTFSPNGHRIVIGGPESIYVFDWPSLNMVNAWGAGPTEEHFSGWYPELATNGRITISTETGSTEFGECLWVGSLEVGRGCDTTIPDFSYNNVLYSSFATLFLNSILNGDNRVRSGLAITTPDGTRRIVGASDGTVRFYSVGADEREVAVFHMPAAVTNLQMTSDGLRLIISLGERSARVWDIHDPSERVKDVRAKWAERGPAGQYLDNLWAGPTPTEEPPAADGTPGGLRGVIDKDPSLTPLRRLVAAEMLAERIRDLNHDVDEAFAKLTKDQTDKAAVQAAAQAADLPPRVKDKVIAKAKEWTYTPSETEAPAKARPVDSK